MKLFTRLFSGIGIGIALAALIFVGNKLIPFVSCAGHMICGVVTLDASHCSEACVAADQANHLRDAIPANYKTTTIYSLVLCGGIGAIWGIAGAISDASKKHKQKVYQHEMDIKNQREANNNSVKKAIRDYLVQAEKEYKSEQNLSQYAVDYEFKRLKNVTDMAAQQCVEEKEKLKKLLNSLDII